MGGAERGCGTIFRGSGRAGAAAGGLAATGAAASGAGVTAGFTGAGRLHRHTNVALLLFLFVLFGQDRFQHIAGFRDVREIDLGDDGLFCMTRGGSSGMRSVTRFLGKMRTYFIRLLRLN